MLKSRSSHINFFYTTHIPRYQVRPIGIGDVTIQPPSSELFLYNPANPGKTVFQPTYWSFIAKWIPISGNVSSIKKVNMGGSTFKPKIDIGGIANNNEMVLIPTEGGLTPCGQAIFKTSENASIPNPATPEWWSFMKVYPIDQVTGLNYNNNYSYNLKQDMVLELPNGETKKFSVWQIHYGLRATDQNGEIINGLDVPKRIKWEGEDNDWDFTFWISSNVKWEAASFRAFEHITSGSYELETNALVDLDNTTIHDGTYLSPKHDDSAYPRTYGPEEHPYGEERKVPVTIRFKKTNLGPNGSIRVIIFLSNYKLNNEAFEGGVSMGYTAGSQSVVMEFFNNP